MHYKKINKDKFEDLHSKKKIEKSKLKSEGVYSKKSLIKMSRYENTSDNLRKDISIDTIVNYTYEYISSVPDYTWHTGCVPTTGANIVRYCDANGYNNLVTGTTTTNQLIDTLAKYMKTGLCEGCSNDATTFSDAMIGMAVYWGINGYGDVEVYSYYDDIFTEHKSAMVNKKPDIVWMNGHPTYKDHAVTGVGFEEYQDSDNNFEYVRQVIVHDTWDTTAFDVWLPWDP